MAAAAAAQSAALSQADKDKFRQYLEKSGAVDTLTKLLVSLYEEKERPQNSIDWLKANLGAGADVAALQKENEQLRKRVAELEAALAAKSS